jgi:tetratricopeptide (TPR) repeat protein
MEPTEIVESVVGSANPEEVLKEHRGTAGLSRAFFQRVQREFTSRPDEARRLAKLWSSILKFGDDPAYAYRIKGASDRLQGRYSRSAAAFQKAGELAKDPLDRLVFQTGAVDSLGRCGKIDAAVELGRRLREGLEELGEAGLAGRVCLNVGNALQYAERNAEAREWFDEAVSRLDAEGLSLEALFARLGRSTAELYGGRITDAERLAAETRVRAEEAGEEYVAAMCDFGRAHSLLLQGRADEALRILLDLRPLIEDSSYDLARLDEFLGDCYLALNLWPEALDAYNAALVEGAGQEPIRAALVDFGAGQALCASGDRVAGIQRLARAAAKFQRMQNSAWAAAATTRLAEERLAVGDSKKALTLARKAVSQARSSAAAYHLANALMACSSCQRANGVRLGRELAEGARIIEQGGFYSLAWRPVAVRARTALPAQRLRRYREAAEAILRDRLLVRSSVSRAAYLRDKGQYLSEFVALLLEKPTPARIQEAIDIVTRSRSAALMDELLGSSGDLLSQNQLQEIESLRSEINALEGEGRDTPGARRTGSDRAQISGIQRKWIEATHRLIEDGSSVRSEIQGAILSIAGNDIYCLEQGRATKLPIRPDELSRRLAWLKFDLFAPMSERDADPRVAIELLDDLREALVEPWFRSRGEVSPEGALWQVPWTACMDVEPVLCLNPRLAHSIACLPSRPKTMLWVHRADDLPFASVEEEAFLERFPDSIVCRNIEEARKALASEVDLLHVIGHARPTTNNPMFSRIRMEGGDLFATEIAGSRFQPGIVTLSACETGALSTSFREEPDGLARAFLARRAKSVVGSLWPLDDETAATMFTTVFDGLAAGASLKESLRISRQSARKWRSHPYYWGSLALFGGYA